MLLLSLLLELNNVFRVHMALFKDNELPRTISFRVRQDRVCILGDDAIQAVGLRIVHVATKRSAQQDISVPVGTLDCRKSWNIHGTFVKTYAKARLKHKNLQTSRYCCHGLQQTSLSEVDSSDTSSFLHIYPSIFPVQKQNKQINR